MKKFLPYILIFFIVVQLFAPFTVGTGVKNNIEIQKNTARAENNIKMSSIAFTNSNSIKITTEVSWESNNLLTKEQVFAVVKDTEGNLIEKKDVLMVDSSSGNNKQTGSVEFNKNLKPDTQYQVYTYAVQGSVDIIDLSSIFGLPDVPDVSITGTPNPNPLLVKTQPQGSTESFVGAGTQNSVSKSPGDLPACEIEKPGSWFTGCIAQALYYLFFKTSSFVFALSGKALDFTLMYSISDTSYRSAFVVEGWGIMKDFSNMFFIFVLLYIAFGTILNLHSVKTKEMIINVVIIGLLINFSLFTTQVVIDASNILTRVFYNQKTIVIGKSQKDSNGDTSSKKSELGDFGEIKLSEAIVSKVNPQELIMSASEVESIPIRGTMSGEDQTKTDQGISTGTFIIVIFLATAINIVGTIAFLSSALIFIGRVVMLWLSMILAPIAFFSYIVPSLQDIKMVGWKKWWPDLLKMAFVAPVFAFFMYIIVGFLEKGLGIIDASTKTGKGGLTFVIAIVVPFAFIMILLMKAKSIAIDMSGEIGASLSKAGAAVGGIALGAATGGAAFAMRGTIGKLGQTIGESNFAKKGGRLGRMVGDAGKWTAGKTFDARNTVAGAAAAKGMGVDLGKAKEGGYTKHLSEKVEKKQKRAEELKVTENEPLKQKLNREEIALQSVLNKVNSDFETIDKKLIAARQKKQDAAGGPTDPDYIAAVNEIKELNKTKDAMKKTDGSSADTDKIAADNAQSAARANPNDQDLANIAANLAAIAKVSAAIKETGGVGISIKQMESVNIPNAKKEIETENRNRTTAYAKELGARGGKANKEAEHKIIMNSKI